MKLHVMNDLHIEIEDFEPPATDADAVVLAGNVGVGLEDLCWTPARFPDRPVTYVPGNHEFYSNIPTCINSIWLISLCKIAKVKLDSELRKMHG